MYAGRRIRIVQIENLEWEDCVRRYDASDALFVMDPPYHSHTRVSPTVYAHEMSRDGHERLMKMACKLKGKALICGYRHELYDRILKGWARVELPGRSFASPRTGSCKCSGPFVRSWPMARMVGGCAGLGGV